MNTYLHRALVAPAGFIACLTLLWADACTFAADALPSTISQIRNAQFAGVNTIEALLYRWPHDYYAVVPPSPIAQTNVSVSGLTAEALTNKLHEVLYHMVCSATNLNTGTSTVTNMIVVTAKEAAIPSIFPRAGWNVPSTTLEMAQIQTTFALIPNGTGGFIPPSKNQAGMVPINIGGYVFIPFPNLKYFDGAPPPIWYLDSTYERQTYARIFVGNPNGSISEIPSKTFGDATINQRLEYGQEDRLGEYLDTDNMKLLRLYNIGRIGIHLSLLTNGAPAVLALEAADGSTPRYWLPTGQPIVSPMITGVSLANNMPKIGIAGFAGQKIVVESSTTLFGSGSAWVTEMTLPTLPESGIANYTCPMPVNAAGTSNRFWRVRALQP